MKSWIRPALVAGTLSSILAAAPIAAQTTAPAPAPKAAAPSAIGEGQFLIRVRGLGFVTADKSDAVPLLGLAADKITLSDRAMPEIDVTWFPHKYVGIALSASYPQEHETFVNGTKIGSFKQTPLAALAQYHVRPTATIRPYLGAGVMVSPISDVNLVGPGLGRFSLEDASVGPIGQIGVDVKVATGIFLNVDARYALMKNDLSFGTNKVSTLTWSPIMFGGGIGFRF